VSGPATRDRPEGAAPAVDNPYHCEVIGSLLRPEPLKEAMERGEDPERLAALQDRYGARAIELQEECGIDVVTDGEVRRRFWFDPLTESLSGYSSEAPAPVPFGASASLQELKLPAVSERLSLEDNLPLRELTFCRQHTDRAVKTTLPGLTYASVLWVPGVSDAVYPDRDEYLGEALQLVKRMVSQLVEAGAGYVQLDSPRYTHLVSEDGRANLERIGIDTGTWLQQMIDLDNALIDAFPDLTWGLHLCRGNHRSMWSVEGGYDAIAEQLFGEIHADRLALEYDSPRAGSFAPLRFVPDDKVVILGLITTKEPELESADLLKRRLEEASEHVPLERLALSPQCGFASTLPGNLVSEEAQRAKLERLGEVAREVWG
jgi:5-methyltetrahydropteroyltriglutamate--homocysteine methyltransferase